MQAVRTASVPALNKALTVLETLAQSRVGLTLPELVERTGLSKSTVHSLLVTLQRRGYLHRNEHTGRYAFDLKLFSLIRGALNGLTLQEDAGPLLRALMKTTRLTTHMAILENREAVLVSKIEPVGVRVASWVGKQMDVHCTALGKALVAFLPDEELDAIIQEHGLPRHNENTICSRTKIREELSRVARYGYATDDEEDEIGFRCVGAPVLDYNGNVVASISIAGNTDQITSENMAYLAGHVMQTAAEISRAVAMKMREF